RAVSRLLGGAHRGSENVMKIFRRSRLVLIGGLIAVWTISGCSTSSGPERRTMESGSGPTPAEADSSSTATVLDEDSSGASPELPAPVPGATPPISSGVAQTDLSGSTQMAASGSPAMTANAREAGILLDEYQSHLADLRQEIESLRGR